MERIYTEADVKPALAGKTIAIIGYGSQGRAHAQNLRDSGFSVIVGARADGSAGKRAKADGFEVFSYAEAAQKADLVALLTPDMSHREVYAKDIAADFWAIAGALVISCLVTLVFVGVLMQKLINRQGKNKEQP